MCSKFHSKIKDVTCFVLLRCITKHYVDNSHKKGTLLKRNVCSNCWLRQWVLSCGPNYYLLYRSHWRHQIFSFGVKNRCFSANSELKKPRFTSQFRKEILLKRARTLNMQYKALDSCLDLRKYRFNNTWYVYKRCRTIWGLLGWFTPPLIFFLNVFYVMSWIGRRSGRVITLVVWVKMPP